MKTALTLLGALLSFTAFAQSQPPTPEQIRQFIAADIAALKVKPQPVAKVLNTAVWTGTDSVKVRVYFPAAARPPYSIIFQVHGGALVAGDLATHDNISRVLANRTRSIVVAADYRKPPEHPFPAGLRDCAAVLRWIRQQAGAWGGDARRLALVGDSGGGLLVAALLVQEHGRVPVHKVVLVNPATDLRTPGDGLYGLVTQLYLQATPPTDSLASPVLARRVAYMPPTLVVTCAKDELKPHGVAWYRKLQQARVPVRLLDIPNQDHLGGFWAAAHPTAKPAVEAAIQFLNGPAAGPPR